MLFLDLDGFKRINDSLGHSMGDRLLAAVGERIGLELRAVDTGARFGGDEFAILLHDTDAEGALNVARRVQASLAAPLEIDGADLSVRASLGIATSTGGELTSEDVLRDADAAMYRAKGLDPGSVVLFDDEMRKQASREHSSHAEIRRALDEDQFGVFYQPVVELASGRLLGVEAQVRWHHPERGLVLPEEFLPAMEETGLVVRLGARVLDEICRGLVEWGSLVPRVSVTVSDRQFWQAGAITQVLGTLADAGLAAERLALEVSEDILQRHPERALRRAQELSEAGLPLRLGGIGAGRSSVEALDLFPVEGFTIDRELVGRLGVDGRTDALLSGLVGLGSALGLAVAAEGIESHEQLAALRAAGCLAGQGPLFASAVPADEIPAMVRRLGSGAGATETDGRERAAVDVALP